MKLPWDVVVHPGGRTTTSAAWPASEGNVLLGIRPRRSARTGRRPASMLRQRSVSPLSLRDVRRSFSRVHIFEPVASSSFIRRDIECKRTSYKVEKLPCSSQCCRTAILVYTSPQIKCKHCHSSSPSRLHMGFVHADGCTTVDAGSFRPPGLAHLLQWAIYSGRQQQLRCHGQAGSDLDQQRHRLLHCYARDRRSTASRAPCIRLWHNCSAVIVHNFLCCMVMPVHDAVICACRDWTL